MDICRDTGTSMHFSPAWEFHARGEPGGWKASPRGICAPIPSCEGHREWEGKGGCCLLIPAEAKMQPGPAP